MDEPSVLDYLKAKLAPWRGEAARFEAVLSPEREASIPSGDRPAVPVQPTAEPVVQAISWPWRSLVALALALFAQRSFEPAPERSWQIGAFFYLLAAAWLVWANWRGEWSLASLPDEERQRDPYTIRLVALWIAIPLALLAFLALGGNLFTQFNVLIWLGALALMVYSLWLPQASGTHWPERLGGLISQPRWNLAISRWTLLILAVSALVLFFRINRLEQVPPEMVSDHAEKLLDVADIFDGQTRIFFPRNTGREGLQMYLTAAVAQIFGTGLTFTSLKIGTILGGLLTLPYIYLLGKEVGNRRVGLFALVFAGIAYWPNIISRVALRFTLFPLFAAPTLYYLIRGIRRSNRNDFILAGIALGIGLHGYTPLRVLPIVVVLAVALYLLHRQSTGMRKQTIWGLIILALVALIIFLPLLRFWLAEPELFNYRSLTRLSTIEQPLPGPALQIFLFNLWKALAMFAWDNGEVWLVSITGRPALDVVSAALFHLGVVLLLVRYLRRRHWLDLFLLLAVPVLMLPSILSLAFPSENPVLNRTAGALVVVFLIVGICLDGLLSAIESRLDSTSGRRLAWGLAIILLGWSSAQNYDLVFNQYYRAYRLFAWNTTELGAVVRGFAESAGSLESAWVVPYPHWVDTRLVGINAGYPGKDFALWPQHFEETLEVSGPKMFLLKHDDHESLGLLEQLYPEGWVQPYPTQFPTKEFLTYFVPPQDAHR